MQSSFPPPLFGGVYVGVKGVVWALSVILFSYFIIRGGPFEIFIL